MSRCVQTFDWYCILNKNINTSCKVLVPCFMSWNKRSQKCSICTQSLFLSNVVQKFVYIPASKNFSFAKIIHPPDRCGISRSCLNSMIITQGHLVLGTIKGHSKICSFVTQHEMPQMSQVLRDCAIGVPTTGMSTRAFARELNVNFSTKSLFWMAGPSSQVGGPMASQAQPWLRPCPVM